MRTHDFRRAAWPRRARAAIDVAPRVRQLAALALAASCACFTVAAQAADAYPSKPITMVVPYPPGGPTDIVGRIVSATLSGLRRREARSAKGKAAKKDKDSKN